MPHTYRILPTYSADVFGVCSALFELGGMIVIHDPSGCNSTYTTHDEPRWYDSDSQIYITGFSEKDAIFGSENRIYDEIYDAVQMQHPRFVCLIASQMSNLTGVDLKFVAKKISARCQTVAFTISTDSISYYTRGIYRALETVAEKFLLPVSPCEKINKINVLGFTPLDFSLEDYKDLKKNLILAGVEINACWCIGATLDDIAASGRATANLAISYGGLGAARVMHDKCNIPFLVGVPWVGTENDYEAALAKPVNLSRPVYLTDAPRPNKKIFIIGESVIAGSLAYLWQKKFATRPTVICPTETEDWLLNRGDYHTDDEREITEILSSAEIIVADPLYQPVCPSKAKFISFPHPACSGRLYQNKMRHLFRSDEISKFFP